MNIRLVNEDDIVLCGRIYSAAFSQPPYKDVWMPEDASEMLLGLLERDPDSCWCIEVDGEIGGFVFCTTFGEFRATIQEFAVAPEYQKHGIGTALIEYALSQFREMGLIAVDLVVNKRAPALKLYKRFGFFQPENYILMTNRL
ncbi:MAG: GNAT family N-acetyltransferase [Armatimonadota bacterium]